MYGLRGEVEVGSSLEQLDSTASPAATLPVSKPLANIIIESVDSISRDGLDTPYI